MRTVSYLVVPKKVERIDWWHIQQSLIYKTGLRLVYTSSSVLDWVLVFEKRMYHDLFRHDRKTPLRSERLHGVCITWYNKWAAYGQLPVHLSFHWRISSDLSKHNGVRYNNNHVLHQLLPPEKDIHYKLRRRSHSLTLPSEDNNLIKKNVLHKMLFRDIFYRCRCLYCVIVFNFNISMYFLTTLHPMLHCICMNDCQT